MWGRKGGVGVREREKGGRVESPFRLPKRDREKHRETQIERDTQANLHVYL